jgi:hypothetical protein
MIRRSAVVYIAIVLALTGAYFYLRGRTRPAEIQETPGTTTEVRYLFPVETGYPTGILVQAKSGEAVEVARNADNAWMLIQPVEAEAEQGASEAAASQVSTMRILNHIPEVDRGLVGLEDPAYVLTVQFNSGTERSINIGVVTPTESGYYVQDASGGEVLIVSKSAIESVLRLLSTPPYLETPEPEPPP